jgi:hypothetical protein
LIRNCRVHFLNTLNSLPPQCWILCDGKTAWDATLSAAQFIRAYDVAAGRYRLSAGILAVGDRTLRFGAWNLPAFYCDKEATGHAVKCLMDVATLFARWCPKDITRVLSKVLPDCRFTNA